MKLAILVCLGAAALRAAETPRVRITFTPESAKFAAAAREYTDIWSKEGERIVDAMEAASGLKFQETDVHANVFEAASYSGYRDSPMVLRASYPLETKKAALIHELGHRLMFDLLRRDEEEHMYLFLWLYDTWVKLYGLKFADEQVAVEKARGRVYPAAWEAALALSAEERAVKWRETLAARRQ